jgi:hypothetical protein
MALGVLGGHHSHAYETAEMGNCVGWSTVLENHQCVIYTHTMLPSPNPYKHVGGRRKRILGFGTVQTPYLFKDVYN